MTFVEFLDKHFGQVVEATVYLTSLGILAMFVWFVFRSNGRS